VPSSGMSMSRAKAVIAEMPGMETRMPNRRAKAGSALMIAMISASMAAIWRSICLSCSPLWRLRMARVRFFALFFATVRFFTSASRAMCRSLRSLRAGLPHRPRLEVKPRTHAGQHGRAQPVGFGEPAGGLGKAPRLTRVDLDQRKACLRQPALEGPVIGTSRLIDDAAAGLSQPVDEGCVALRVVAKATACAVAGAVGVEMVFRDVDADGIVRHLSLVLCLSSAAQP